MGRESTETEGVRSAAARGVAPAARGDGPAGRAPKFGRHSSKVVVGRTIGEKREKLETKNERAAARKKDKQKYYTRVITVSIGFIILIVVLIVLVVTFFHQETKPLSLEEVTSEPVLSAEPTIEIVDASASATGGKITSRMRNYIGLIESDLKGYNYQPVRAIIPTDSIREVDIYLDGYTGYFKTTIDRDAAITAEDIDRMLRYLAEQGITAFEYVDVRIDGRAFWK